MFFPSMKSEDIEKHLETKPTIIIPIGSLEQHGPHLPVGTDYFIVDEITKQVSVRTNTLRIPPIQFGMSHHHSKFKGTISLRPSQLMILLKGIITSLIDQGFKDLIIVNSHNGNRATIKATLQDIDIEEDINIKLINIWEIPIVNKFVDKVFEKDRGSHAGPGETSIMLSIMANSVELDKCKEYLENFEYAYIDGLVTPNKMKEVYPYGIFNGNPVLANEKIGKLLVDKMVESLIKELE